MKHSPTTGVLLASLAIFVGLAACGPGDEPTSADYPQSIDEASADARDAGVDFRVAQAVIEGQADEVRDEKDLDRLEAPLTSWSAEVTELVAELDGLEPPPDAADAHEQLLSVARDKQAALERLERAIDRRDVDAFEAALVAARDADEEDDQVQAELQAAGYQLPFTGPTTETPPGESRDLERQADREYEVATDNEAASAAEAGSKSVEAQEGLPDDQALATNPSALREIGPPFEREAREADAAADGLDGVTPPPAAADLHRELVAAQRQRAAAASDVAEAAKRGDLEAYQRAGPRYQEAADRQRDAVDNLDDAGYGFVAFGSAPDDASEDEQHVARSG